MVQLVTPNEAAAAGLASLDSMLGVQGRAPAANPGRGVHGLLPVCTSHALQLTLLDQTISHQSSGVQTLVCGMQDMTSGSWLDSRWSRGATSARRPATMTEESRHCTT